MHTSQLPPLDELLLEELELLLDDELELLLEDELELLEDELELLLEDEELLELDEELELFEPGSWPHIRELPSYKVIFCATWWVASYGPQEGSSLLSHSGRLLVVGKDMRNWTSFRDSDCPPGKMSTPANDTST